jgi:transposase
VSAGQASGAGRRLTPDEERRGAELFAQGLSTRQVAAQLGVGNGTAARLRRRLAERAASRSEPEETTTMPGHDASQIEITALPDPDDAAELSALTAQREDQAAEVEKYVSRAEASMHAVAELEAERMHGLAEGREVQGLRERRRNADDDARDFADAAKLAHGRLEETDRQIQAVLARQADRQLRAELAEAVAERDAVLAAVGERQRSAVLAVAAAAADFTAALADELAVLSRVDQLAARIALGGPVPAVPPPVSTSIGALYDAVAREPLALARAVSEARAGRVAAVAEQLGICNGWLPVSPAELAAERERMLALRAPQPQPAASRPVQMDPRFGASYGVDEHGNALPPPSPAELERRSQPAPAGPGGWLGGQPWPQ